MSTADEAPSSATSAQRLAGRVAIVTGAGQGIGRGIALALAREGAAVAAIGRTEEKLVSVKAELEALGALALAIPCDVGDRAAVDQMVEEVCDGLGGVDVLVNNAQSFVFRVIAELSDDDVELAYRSGTLGTLYAMQACLPQLTERRGNIVNVGTSSALTGEARFASYAMAKEAIRALTRVAATEWGPLGIRVNCVCPSAASPAYAAWAAEHPEDAVRIAEGRPLGRMGDPERDIGRAVAAVAGDDFGYLTGATLMLNGGMVYLD